MYTSLKVAPEYIPKVRLTLRQHRFSSQNELAYDLEISRSTVGNFFNGKPISYRNFIDICEKLELDWQEIATLDEIESISLSSDINILVQQVRQKCSQKIQTFYSHVKLLDISRPIDVEKLYVEVDFLEDLPHLRWLDIESLSSQFDAGKLNYIQLSRFPTLEVIKSNPRLLILGKLGTGKTMLLQYLAIACLQGQLNSHLIPIFIRLRDFAQYCLNHHNISLLDYINREWESCGIHQPDLAHNLLLAGRGFILLDGLDEVPINIKTKIIQEIRETCHYYYQNKWIVSCRLGERGYKEIQDQFFLVEIANFNPEQIKNFVQNWFTHVANHPQLIKPFFDNLYQPENQSLQELAVTPILLHFLCLIFDGQGKFFSSRTKLYESILNIFLLRWDCARGIQRTQINDELSLREKKALISQIAMIMLEQNTCFFDTKQLLLIINCSVQKLSDHYPRFASSSLNNRHLLKMLVVQHGLMIESARGIYTFSHQTLQHYLGKQDFCLH